MEKDQDFVEAIKQGGKHRQRAITLLFKHYSPQFSRYFRRNRITEPNVEDIVQNTFVNIVRGISGYRGDCPLKNWLWTVARNTMLTFFQNPSHKFQIQEETDIDDIEVSHLTNTPGTLEDCVTQALDDFSKDHHDRAEVVRLATIEGWSSDELAKFIGRTLGATREYISQCKKRFNVYLQPCKDYL
ncbi:MAG: hypothetical protein DIZ80_08155 [endosymbiont of Galathealinum brachiosum]|uniref:RNA polymerase sigma-70 region 2 domain-containing protein n=1 Tax=endosymbiont of Galathealinum brachiosum TaxID=2200906 RepID=A0A370DGP1_9GAMM|nr:MAG: hypothetical protein DIZ80_08155 [endosymbiont of Galathealinum brachiosum]